MVGKMVLLSHVAYAVLGAVAVAFAVSLCLGRSFWKNAAAASAAYIFLFVLYGLGIGAAGWALVALTCMVALGVLSSMFS